VSTASQNSRPIGILDSGVGGLSILSELRRTLPQENFIYFGDTLHAPYGSRDEREIRDLIDQAATMLLRRCLKALVLGSSTITTVALDYLRATHSLPIVGTYPAVSLAVEATRSGVVGVLSTRATAQGELLEALIGRFATPTRVRVLKAWHNDLVPLIERGQVDTPAVRTILRKILDPLAHAGVDQLVLAATHFTFLRPIIITEFGDTFGFVDSAATVATDLTCLLDQRDLRTSDAGSGSTLFLFTGDPEQARAAVAILLNSAVSDNRIRAEELDVRSALSV
jgi:glutamate racemase